MPIVMESSVKVYKFKFDLQPGSLTDQVAGEHQPSKKQHTINLGKQEEKKRKLSRQKIPLIY